MSIDRSFAVFNREGPVFFGQYVASLGVRRAEVRRAPRQGRTRNDMSRSKDAERPGEPGVILAANPPPTMACLSDRLPLNVAGRFFVDSSCIDCDQCRTEAPDFFSRDAENGTSYVSRQPVTDEEIALVQQAATNCATGSIGDETAP